MLQKHSLFYVNVNYHNCRSVIFTKQVFSSEKRIGHLASEDVDPYMYNLEEILVTISSFDEILSIQLKK